MWTNHCNVLGLQSVLPDRYLYLTDRKHGRHDGQSLKVAVDAKGSWQRRTDVVCWNCRKPSHLARHCKNETLCGRCSCKGHRTKECPSADTSTPDDGSGAIELSNLSVEVFNKAVGASRGVYLPSVNNSHEISLTASNGTSRSCNNRKFSVRYCDSGSSSNLTNSRSGMVNVRRTNRETRVASGNFMPCEGVDDSRVIFVCDREDVPGTKNSVIVTLRDVLYAYRRRLKTCFC